MSFSTRQYCMYQTRIYRICHTLSRTLQRPRADSQTLWQTYSEAEYIFKYSADTCCRLLSAVCCMLRVCSILESLPTIQPYLPKQGELFIQLSSFEQTVIEYLKLNLHERNDLQFYNTLSVLHWQISVIQLFMRPPSVSPTGITPLHSENGGSEKNHLWNQT